MSSAALAVVLIASSGLCGATCLFAKENHDGGRENRDGLGLLIDALRNSGFNRTLIWSGRLKFACRHTEPKPVGEEFEKGLADQRKMIEDYLQSIPRDGQRNREHLKQQIANARDLYEKQLEASNRTDFYDVLFKGSEPFDFIKEWVTFPSKEGELARSPILASGGSDGTLSGEVYVALADERRTMEVWEHFHSYAYNQFGRIRGTDVAKLTALFFVGTDELKTRQFVFNEEVVRQAKEFNQRSLAEGHGVGVRLVRREAYDEKFEPSTAYVVERPESGLGTLAMKKMRVWIDPNRGYICPRVEFFEGDKPYLTYRSEGYFLEENSGLWWPRLHEEIIYDRLGSGKWIGTNSFEFPPDGVALNIPISDEEFEISVEKGVHIIDRRGGAIKPYFANADVRVSPANGKLDLGAISALGPPPGPPANGFGASGGSQVGFGTVFLGANFVVIAVAVSVVLARRKRKAGRT